MRLRLILDADSEDMVLAMRAGTSLLKHPSETQDMIIAFGGESGKTKDFYVKRNKSSISVRQLNSQSRKRRVMPHDYLSNLPTMREAQ
jgi:hypothetical protein